MQNFCILLGGYEKMKTLRQTCTAIVMTLVLAVSVFAGQISSPGVVSPPPPPPQQSTTEVDLMTMILEILDLMLIPMS